MTESSIQLGSWIVSGCLGNMLRAASTGLSIDSRSAHCIEKIIYVIVLVTWNYGKSRKSNDRTYNTEGIDCHYGLPNKNRKSGSEPVN